MQPNSTEARQACLDLAYLLWKSLDWDRWGQYRRTIHDIFQNALSASAEQASTLSRFAGGVTRQLGIGAVGRNAAEAAQFSALLTSGLDNALMPTLRTEAALIVANLRARLEVEKQQRAGVPVATIPDELDEIEHDADEAELEETR